MKKVIVITGPTAVGKTKVSIEVANILKTELINADAFQIYKGLDILTAKPTREEQSLVKHHLINQLDPFKPFSIYQYQKMVRKMIDDSNIPILVGGSGLYIDSVLYNYQFNDEDDFDDTKYQSYTNEELHQILETLDPENALKIHPNNRKRVIRAIHLAKTQAKSERSLKNEKVYEPLIIFLNLERNLLYQRINQRVLKMDEDGLVEEVLKEEDYTNTQLGKAIGYIDAQKFIHQEIDKAEMIDNIQKASRHYAKRQFTWFRNHQDTTIIDVNLDNINQTVNEIITIIKSFIA